MRFGYILDMKVGEKKNLILLYCWLPSGTYHRNLMIWIIFFLWNLANLGLFSLENPFLKGGNHIYIFRLTFGDISCPSKAIKLTGTRNILCPRVYWHFCQFYMPFHYNAQKEKPTKFSKSSNSFHHKFQMRDAEHSFQAKAFLWAPWFQT